MKNEKNRQTQNIDNRYMFYCIIEVTIYHCHILCASKRFVLKKKIKLKILLESMKNINKVTLKLGKYFVFLHLFGK